MANKKASGIVKDAFNLSNLGNTAFATHSELTEYINDGFTSLYNELINKGNDYWLKEAFPASSISGNGDYFLPPDFYRAKNICSGHYLIPRKSNSGSGYSIRNGMLHLDGQRGNIKMEYYPKPTHLSFPSTDIDIPKELISMGESTMAWNEYVVDNEKIVTNLETNAAFDLSTLPNEILGIGNGFVISTDSQGDKQLYDFYGNEVVSPLQSPGYFILGTSGNPYSVLYDSEDNVSTIQSSVTGETFITFTGRNDYVMLVNDVDENVPGVWSVEPGENDIIKAWHFMDMEGNDYSVDAKELNTFGTFRYGYCSDWSDNSIYVCSGNKVALLTLTDTGIEMVEYRIPSIVNAGLVKYHNDYYYLTGDYLGYHLKGYEPDTLMEYPTNVFYRALSSYIAIQILAKQQADTTNMQASFASLVDTLTKSEDNSADYPVIKNFY
jgi:hypothetical protein